MLTRGDDTAIERDTITVYEERAELWRDRRPARFLERAEGLGQSLPPGVVRADLGCGAGKHLHALGRPVVALDGALAMLRLARAEAPDAWCVQADLELLPLRRGSLGGAWARASYLHVARNRLPWALAQLHASMTAEAPFVATFMVGDTEGTIPDDDFPGRFFACWQPDPLVDVLEGAGFKVSAYDVGEEWINVAATRARTVPDYVGDRMRVLLVAPHPSLAAAEHGLVAADDPLWSALIIAGAVAPDQSPLDALTAHGIGMTHLVKRTPSRDDEPEEDEYRAGAERVQRLVAWLRPEVVAVVGRAGSLAMVGGDAKPGEQRQTVAGARVYVVPDPTDLSTPGNVDDVAAHVRAAIALS